MILLQVQHRQNNIAQLKTNATSSHLSGTANGYKKLQSSTCLTHPVPGVEEGEGGKAGFIWQNLQEIISQHGSKYPILVQ